MKVNRDLTDDQYQAQLLRLRQQIADGLPLVSVDDNTPGNKHSEVSWGLCTTDWPRDALFREDRPILGSAHRGPDHKCPFDQGPPGTDHGWGCFWRCHVFQGRLNDPTEALKLYDITIAERVPSKD